MVDNLESLAKLFHPINKIIKVMDYHEKCRVEFTAGNPSNRQLNL